MVIASHLSARLLILRSVFSVGWVWPQLLSRFRNVSKGVACAQTSVLFRNAIKSSCLQKVCTLMQVCRSQCCASGLIVATSIWPKTVMRVRKNELGD